MKLWNMASIVVLAITITVGCSEGNDGSTPEPTLCRPGAVLECAGELGCLGLLTCDASGEAWSACDCGGISMGFGGTPGSGAVGGSGGVGAMGGASGGTAGTAGMPGGSAGQAGEGGDGGAP